MTVPKRGVWLHECEWSRSANSQYSAITRIDLGSTTWLIQIGHNSKYLNSSKKWARNQTCLLQRSRKKCRILLLEPKRSAVFSLGSYELPANQLWHQTAVSGTGKTQLIPASIQLCAPIKPPTAFHFLLGCQGCRRIQHPYFIFSSINNANISLLKLLILVSCQSK